MWTGRGVEFLAVFVYDCFAVTNVAIDFMAVGIIEITCLDGFPIIGFQSLCNDSRCNRFADIRSYSCDKDFHSAIKRQKYSTIAILLRFPGRYYSCANKTASVPGLREPLVKEWV